LWGCPCTFYIERISGKELEPHGRRGGVAGREEEIIPFGLEIVKKRLALFEKIRKLSYTQVPGACAPSLGLNKGKNLVFWEKWPLFVTNRSE
jgi:hypothetical protein